MTARGAASSGEARRLSRSSSTRGGALALTGASEGVDQRVLRGRRAARRFRPVRAARGRTPLELGRGDGEVAFDHGLQRAAHRRHDLAEAGSACASEVVRSAASPTSSAAAARLSAECRAANGVGGVISQPSGAESQTASPAGRPPRCR